MEESRQLYHRKKKWHEGKSKIWKYNFHSKKCNTFDLRWKVEFDMIYQRLTVSPWRESISFMFVVRNANAEMALNFVCLAQKCKTTKKKLECHFGIGTWCDYYLFSLWQLIQRTSEKTASVANDAARSILFVASVRPSVWHNKLHFHKTYDYNCYVWNLCKRLRTKRTTTNKSWKKIATQKWNGIK